MIVLAGVAGADGLVESVNVEGELDLVVENDLVAELVVETALLVVLSLSSPHIPVSQGSVEQHPVKGPMAQR